MKHLKYFGELYERFMDSGKHAPRLRHHTAHTDAPTINKPTGVMTAADMMDMEFDEVDFQGDWLELLGTPAPNFDMLVHGEPGSGKTTFLLKFSKYLSLNFGKVLYVSSEEYGASTLTDMLKDNEIVSEQLFFANDLSQPLDDYDFVVIDSVNDLGVTLGQFKELREQYPMTAMILVLQHTKSGDYRGGKDWEHEVEIAGEVTEGVIEIYRNRYGTKGALNVFEPISDQSRKMATNHKDH